MQTELRKRIADAEAAIAALTPISAGCADMQALIAKKTAEVTRLKAELATQRPVKVQLQKAIAACDKAAKKVKALSQEVDLLQRCLSLRLSELEAAKSEEQVLLAAKAKLLVSCADTSVELQQAAAREVAQQFHAALPPQLAGLFSEWCKAVPWTVAVGPTVALPTAGAGSTAAAAASDPYAVSGALADPDHELDEDMDLSPAGTAARLARALLAESGAQVPQVPIPPALLALASPTSPADSMAQSSPFLDSSPARDSGRGRGEERRSQSASPGGRRHRSRSLGRLQEEVQALSDENRPEGWRGAAYPLFAAGQRTRRQRKTAEPAGDGGAVAATAVPAGGVPAATPSPVIDLEAAALPALSATA